MKQKNQNIFNKPGNFTTKFIPELILDENKEHFIALDHLSMTASWHNVRPEYENNTLRISKDKGKNWETIKFPSGVYDYEDLNEFIHQKIGKLGGENYWISQLTKYLFSWMKIIKSILLGVETSISCWDSKKNF